MAQARLLTFRDALEHLRYYLGATVVSSEQSVREAIQAAVEQIADAHDWRWLLKHGRIPIKAADSDGTCAYDHTGNASGYERYVTLTDTTFPSDAYDYCIKIGTIQCAIEHYIDSTHCTLDAMLNPGADVDSGTSCTIYPAHYMLPADFISFSGPWSEDDWGLGRYVRPEEWLALNRYRTATGSPEYYTIKAVDDLYGQMGLFIDPPSDSDATVDFMYKRGLRELRYSGFATADTAGTISVTADSPTVTGTGTSFSSDMVNAVIRIGTDSTNIPTRRHQLYPFAEEHTIQSVTDEDTLTLNANVSTTRSGVKYVISDPIDVDRSAYRSFLALATAHLAMARNAKNKAELWALAESMLSSSRSGDSRVKQRQVCGPPRPFAYRLADVPLGDDQE
jgi:hypothetical protein